MFLVVLHAKIALGAWAEPPQVVPFIYSGVTFTHIQQLEYHSSDYQVIVYCPDSFVPKLEYNAYGQQMQLDYYHATANTCIYKSYNDFSDHTWYPTWGYYNGALISSQNGYSPDYSFRSTRDLYFKNETYNFYGYFGLYEVAANELVVEATEFGNFKWPLSGTLLDRGTPALQFGDDWSFGECPTSTVKKHAGLDVDADAEEPVYAAHDGVVKAIFTGEHSTWGDAIVVEDASGSFTTVYWHVIKYSTLAVNDTVTKGQHIAVIADLGGATHFHFGIRRAAYNAHFSLAGALPTTACGSPVLFPAHPEYFVDPETVIYE
ncbi:MAG: M23 family metallopeptidase [Candidatus Moraniibacteriota bacterium]